MRPSRHLVTAGAGLLVALMIFAGLQGAAVLAQGGPQPELVVFTSNRSGNFEIFVLNLQTGLTTQLTNLPANDIEPQWSPDGALIVFASDRDGDYELYVMRPDGTEVRQLTNNTAEDRQPRWLPGGQQIVYSSDVNFGQWDLYMVSADGTIVRQLTNDPADERGPVAPAVPTTGPVTGLATPFPTLTPPGPQADAVVGAGTLNLRANPGTGAQILAKLPQGTLLEVLAKYYDFTYQEMWVQVRTPNGTVGWVFQPLLTLNIVLDSVPTVAAQYIAPPPTPTPTLTPNPVPQVIIEFWADRTEINLGECTKLRWRVEGIKEVYFQGEGVVGTGERDACPNTTTTYNLRVIRVDNVVDNRYITIVVK